MLIEFDARFSCKGDPKSGESPVDMLKRGDFRCSVPILLRYRFYKLNDDEDPHGYSEWVNVVSRVNLRSFHD